MYKHARNELLELGYVQTTPNCFVLAPEFEQVHQRNAWNSYPLLGFGNSAYSFYSDTVAQNVRASRTYNLCIEFNENPTRLFYKLSSRDLMTRYIVLRLKQLFIDTNEFRVRFGFGIHELYDRCIANLIELGLVEASGGRISLTETGILYADDVCRSFYGEEVVAKLAATKSRPDIMRLERSLV